MPDAQSDTSKWGLIDRRTVEFLIDRDGAVEVMTALMGGKPTPQQRAQELVELAVSGKILPLRKQTDAFKEWAETHGLRRLSNALVELDRVLAMEKRGQAILQAQALTRFIMQNINEDIEALRNAVKVKD